MAGRKIERAERRAAEALPGTFMVATALIFAAVIGIAYWFERAYRRWWEANHPFAEYKARIEHMGATYRERRANLAEVVQVFGEIAQALEPGWIEPKSSASS